MLWPGTVFPDEPGTAVYRYAHTGSLGQLGRNEASMLEPLRLVAVEADPGNVPVNVTVVGGQVVVHFLVNWMEYGHGT